MFSRERKKELLQQFALGHISYEELTASIPNGTRPDNRYIQRLFEEAMVNKNPIDLEFALLLINQEALAGQEITEVDVLCRFLFEDWHFSHEDIVNILSRLRSPRYVDCLFRATALHFDYLDYDETYQLARKCIKALAAIKSADAIEKLHILALEPNKVISNYAVKELGRLG